MTDKETIENLNKLMIIAQTMKARGIEADDIIDLIQTAQKAEEVKDKDGKEARHDASK